MCDQARKVAGWCERLGFNDRPRNPVRAAAEIFERTMNNDPETSSDEVAVFMQLRDLRALYEDPDFGPYEWEK